MNVIKKVFLDNLPRNYGFGANSNKLTIDWKKSIGYKVKFIYDDIEGELEIIDYLKGFITIKYLDNILNIKSGDFLKCKIGSILVKSVNIEDYSNYLSLWKDDNSKINKKVFFEVLPTNKGRLDWIKSIGYKIHFIYNDIEDDLTIIDYIKENQYLIIKYNENKFAIKTSQFVIGNLKHVLGLITADFKIEIGAKFQDDKKDLIITDREYRKDKNGYDKKWYKYTCNVCGWTEGWAEEGNLLKGQGCSCCCPTPRISVLGINTIYDTDEWMIPIVGEEFAKTHTHSSMDKIYPVCPDCGKTKNKLMVINNIYNRKSMGCSCSDKIPYPEKFMFNVLEQLGINFEIQLNKTTFSWCQNYKYDFYFEYNNEQYIVETHGEQHYKDAWDKLEKTQENDRLKKQLALQNGIKEENYIIIDCRKSELKWIRDNDDGILNSRLYELFDLSKIDWDKCKKLSLNNLVKEACKMKRENPNMTTTEIGGIMGFNNNTIRRWLIKGNELGWCIYDSKKEKYMSGKMSAPSKFKPTICLNNGMVFKSAKDCSEKSLESFGIYIDKTCISEVCRGKRKQTKGFSFKHISDLTQEEYIIYDIENKFKE